jgi:hypothetical protein
MYTLGGSLKKDPFKVFATRKYSLDRSIISGVSSSFLDEVYALTIAISSNTLVVKHDPFAAKQLTSKSESRNQL